MDLQTMLDNAVITSRNESLKGSPQLLLGELIAKLEPLIANQEAVKEKYGQEANVVFDFEYLKPTGISSWRGSYRELALEFDGTNEFTVTEFVELLKGAIGKTYQGYKGGDFLMGKQTPIWVANYGNSGSTGVVGVLNNEHTVILETARCEY